MYQLNRINIKTEIKLDQEILLVSYKINNSQNLFKSNLKIIKFY